MKYKLFGKSGLRVSELCLGAMGFGAPDSFGSDKDVSKKIFDAFVEGGGNFIDTADIYTEGVSEKWLGEFVHSDREYFVLSTKYTQGFKGHVNATGNHRKHMMEALEKSLKRLNTDTIDIYWVHSWDFLTPVEEVMRGLDDAVRAGKIGYVGVSNTPAWIVARANTIAEMRGWTPFTGLQIEYNLVNRTSDREFLPMALDLDMAVTCYHPLASTILTSDPQELEIRLSKSILVDKPVERQLAIAQKVLGMAKEIGCSPAQVALNWLRQQNGVVIPIVGARTEAHIKDNLACCDWTLNDDQWKYLDEISRIDLGYPYDNLKFKVCQYITYGGTRKSIINHRGWPDFFNRSDIESRW